MGTRRAIVSYWEVDLGLIQMCDFARFDEHSL
jgi:hypothetical protein